MEKLENNSKTEMHDPSFQVMPQLGRASYSSPNPPLPQDEVTYEEQAPIQSTGKKKFAYIIIAIVALLIILALAYFLLGKKEEPKSQEPVSKLPVTWLQKHFNTEACSDPNLCGDAADADKDGLNNYDEFRSGTIPTNPDTDNDGLADGDEVNIYNTDPTLTYTDRRDVVSQNNWTDGYQIKNGYDPLTPAIKFTDSRNVLIEQRIEQFKLHEPTIQTINASESPTQ